MSRSGSVVVLGIGNVLLTDEGVGVAAVERLKEEWSFPANVELFDGGVTGLVGLMPIIEDCDHLIVLDAVLGKGEPGSVARYTLEDFKLTVPKKLSSHDVGFVECVTIAEVNGYTPDSVTVIGVIPEDYQTWGMELTETVRSALDQMIDLTIQELNKLGIEAQSKAKVAN